MRSDIVMMGGMGLLVSVLAPATVLGTRRWSRWPALTLPAAVAGPLFLLVHTVLMVLMVGPMLPMWLDGAAHAALFAAAVLFWAPVFGPGPRRLRDAGRSVYLFLFMPALDMVAIYLIIRGHAAGGLAMIVGMLPIGLIAVAVTWRWMAQEERLEQALTAPAADEPA